MSRILMQSLGEVRPLTFRGHAGGPLLCSAATPWTGVQFEHHRLGDADDVGESGPVDGELGLMIVVRGAYEVLVRGQSGDVRMRSGRGAVRILSGDRRPHVLRVRGSAELMAVRLTPEWLQYLPVDPGEFVSHLPASGGRTICGLAEAVRAEVASGCSAGPLYAESLSMALLSYACSRIPRPALPLANALSWQQRERLCRYIDERLDRHIGLTKLAAVVDLPPRQFSARFRQAFGVTPHRYVTEQRLREGARLLASGRLDIAEIALRVGFCSQSHFTAVFRRAYGLTPKRFAVERRKGVPVRG
jgi:AraC-like DNA-binding protein